MQQGESLQEKYAPANACWGCGPANPEGLQIRSFAKNGEVVAEWVPQPKYEAFPGVLNGGVIGTLLDCHCNWTAAYHLMKRAGADRPPCTVTAEYSIKLLRPTPTNAPVSLSARVLELAQDRATIEGTLTAAAKVCAICRGVSWRWKKATRRTIGGDRRFAAASSKRVGNESVATGHRSLITWRTRARGDSNTRPSD